MTAAIEVLLEQGEGYPYSLRLSATGQWAVWLFGSDGADFVTTGRLDIQPRSFIITKDRAIALEEVEETFPCPTCGGSVAADAEPFCDACGWAE